MRRRLRLAVHRHRRRRPPVLDRPRDPAGATQQTFVRDVFRTGSGVEQGGWRGVLLWDLVNEAAPKVAPSTKNGLLRKYVVVTGSDCYDQTFSLGELSPAIGGNPIVVAYERDGELLGPDDGMARIIAPGDKGGARNVTHVARIRVLDPPG